MPSNLFASKSSLPTINYDLVAIKGGEPDAMFDKAIESLGGMKAFVKKGHKVVVKPNIGWDVEPERAGNTNPVLIKRIVRHCYEGGAKQVYVFDNTCDDWKRCYSNSGIERAVKDAGGKMVSGDSERYYQQVEVKQGKKLISAKVHELILDSDVFINVPILKHHSSTDLTISMSGLWLGDLARKNTQIKIVALADPFQDRLDRGSTRLGIAAERCHRGVDGFKELVASKLDAVAIESPPYYHPEQAMAVVQAGKHVYLAKPVAVDAPGCKTIMRAGQKALGKLSFLVDFQTRNTDFYIEAAKRVHEGAIGKPLTGQVYYHAGRLGTQADPKDTSDAARLRNWVFDKALSGDIIVEQNVHVLDVGNWFLKSHPLKAYGTGGRKARIDVGDCWDHFIVTYWYPNDVLIDFSSGQFQRGYQDLCARIYGTVGTVDSHYGGKVAITGNNP